MRHLRLQWLTCSGRLLSPAGGRAKHPDQKYSCTSQRTAASLSPNTPVPTAWDAGEGVTVLEGIRTHN